MINRRKLVSLGNPTSSPMRLCDFPLSAIISGQMTAMPQVHPRISGCSLAAINGKP